MVIDLVSSRQLQTDLGVKRVGASGPNDLQNESYSRVLCAWHLRGTWTTYMYKRDSGRYVHSVACIPADLSPPLLWEELY